MNIGLLLTRNEEDMIEEMLHANAPYVDTIFALDGSSDGTERILKGHPKVERLLRDEEVALGGRVRDFHRQTLLEAAQERYGFGHWFTLMHGDEIFHSDPRAVIAAAERQGAQRVNWAVMQFFLHPNDAPDPGKPVQERLRWYSPFWVEIRQFRGGKRTAYPPGQHGKVIPDGVGWRPYSKMPLLKHYPYRSPAQMQARLKDIETRGFSGTPPDTTIYRERYSPEYRFACRFSGDFGPLEPERQGNLLTMMWRWKCYVRPQRRGG